MDYSHNGLSIKMSSRILNELGDHYDTEGKYETGGILLGHFGHDFIEITEVYQLKSSLLSKFQYRRSVKKAQKLIDKRWKETNGVVNYLGEWHTHPNMSSVPSSADKCMLSKILLLVGNKIPGVVVIVLGKDKEMTMMIGKENKIYAFLLNRL